MIRMSDDEREVLRKLFDHDKVLAVLGNYDIALAQEILLIIYMF